MVALKGGANRRALRSSVALPLGRARDGLMPAGPAAHVRTNGPATIPRRRRGNRGQTTPRKGANAPPAERGKRAPAGGQTCPPQAGLAPRRGANMPAAGGQ
eukprot:1276898-Rhodomonas_salina.1